MTCGIAKGTIQATCLQRCAFLIFILASAHGASHGVSHETQAAIQQTPPGVQWQADRGVQQLSNTIERFDGPLAVAHLAPPQVSGIAVGAVKGAAGRLEQAPATAAALFALEAIGRKPLVANAVAGVPYFHTWGSFIPSAGCQALIGAAIEATFSSRGAVSISLALSLSVHARILIVSDGRAFSCLLF